MYSFILKYIALGKRYLYSPFCFFRKREINCKINMQNRIPCVEFTASLWQYLFLQFHISSVLIGFEKDMIQIHVFLELLFSLDCHFGGFRLKNEAWWDVYFLILLFRKFFTLTDKISRSARFWHPIHNLNSVALLELRHLNWE